MKNIPDFTIEDNSMATIVVGCDEAGRGPLCGPVVAGAVVFPNRTLKIPVIIRDSKQMTKTQRNLAYNWITENTIWAVAECSPDEIDKLNILQASLTAMTRAVNALPCMSDKPFCLVDGNKMPPKLNGITVVKGDSKSISIASASIIAKVTRDRIMHNLAHQFPQYGWDKNAGYPTESHLQAIKKYGINEHYRKSFKPIKEIIKNENSHS